MLELSEKVNECAKRFKAKIFKIIRSSINTFFKIKVMTY